MAHRGKVPWILSVLLVGTSSLLIAQEFPVPREQAVVVETDMAYTNLDVANPLFVGGNGTQWGSGWHQVVNEWDWYMNYATGERILWRTTGWDYNRAFTQLTWHVRKGVTWNDGVAYTAQDIVYTFNLWLANPDLGGAGTAVNVASVSAPDDYTAIFRFKAPDPRWHQNLRMWGGGNIVAKHIYDKQNVRTYSNWPPVETGPYKLLSYYTDLGMFVWQADPDYWGTKVMGKKPGPKYVIFRKAPPPDLDLREFLKGNVDEPLPHLFTIDMIRAAEKQWTHTVRAPYMDATSQGISGFNTAVAPTNDVNFRWALQFLLDRPTFEKVYPNADSTAQTMWPWPAWESLKKWELPALRQKYGALLRYDPAEAARRLDALGYKKGSDGQRKTPEGKSFTLILACAAMPDLSYLHANDFADELRKIGIDNVVKIRGAGLASDAVQKGQYNVLFDVLGARVAFQADPWQFIDAFASKWAKPVGEIQTAGDYATTRLKDPVLDALAEKMRVMNPDDPAYIGLVQQALDRWYTDLPAVPAVEKMFVQPFSNLYWTNWPTTENFYQLPCNWWPSSIFILFELKPAR